MRIAVTGASGFIGGAVATALADAHHEVVAFGRRAHGWSNPHARYRVWDLDAGLLKGDRDFEAVVHCAALADDWASLAAAMRANRDGTRTVVRSFPGARIVHLSTASVYDAFVPNVEVPESAAPVRRFLSAYAESKTFAEFELAGTDAVILRPHAVYGPGDTTLLPRLIAGARGGRLVLPEGAEVRHSLTHIDNLVHAVLRALDRATPRGTYNIADDAPVVLADVLREVFTRRRMRVRRRDSLPVGLRPRGIPRGRRPHPPSTPRPHPLRREPGRHGAHARPHRRPYEARLPPVPDDPRGRRALVT